MPTLTILGRFSECTRWLMEGAAKLDEEVTSSIMTKGVGQDRAGGAWWRAVDHRLRHEDPPRAVKSGAPA
ncbi:MAG TPA: hypothetical protein VHH34_09665 [Pseudonocardiaceae bacterium]|nr:hypothetical protein [Pseudonocardiaceae bacterium]